MRRLPPTVTRSEKLFTTHRASDLDGLFQHEAEGPSNAESIYVKIYGVSPSNQIVGHNYSRDMENGRNAPTRNLVRQYLCTDGLPAFDGLRSEAHTSELQALMRSSYAVCCV